LKILIEEKAMVKLLKTIGDKEYHTRELLKKLGAYGYGHKLLIKAERIGLVERRTNKNKMYNTLTKKGKEVIKLAKQIGV
jgi:predicted transcriptional regulator